MPRFVLVPFRSLDAAALYGVLALRQRVFVVEQRCAYLDCDGKDLAADHLLGRNEGGELVAYARILPPGVAYTEASIGRVVTDPRARRTGAGKLLMRAAIAETRARHGGPIRIGAQRYLERFYGNFGFVVASAPYDEDGIPHVEMLLA
jgi:ElaA protein